MKRVYSTKPENKGGVFLLLTILAGLFLVYGYVSILLDCSSISDIVIVSLILFAIFAWIYYFLDEAIWLMFGKEKCEYDDSKIVITKHRLFKRRKEIPWNEITDISLYSPGLIVELFTYPSFLQINMPMYLPFLLNNWEMDIYYQILPLQYHLYLYSYTRLQIFLHGRTSKEQ